MPLVFFGVSPYPNRLECVFSVLIILVELLYYFLDSYMSVCAYGSISDNYFIRTSCVDRIIFINRVVSFGLNKVNLNQSNCH